MPSIFDRLRGVSEQVTVVEGPTPEPEVIAAKAVTGPGAISMEINPPLRSLSRTPQKLAAQALETYHSNEWVHLAEGLIDDKFAAVKWHLEDDDGETVAADDADPIRQDILRWLRNPNPIWSRSQTWKLTARHMGLPGRAFWYLDALNTVTGVPQASYLINPARMWAATDKGGNLVGWVMDADRPDGKDPVPFTLDEIIQFPLDPPDSGYYGVGKVESAWRKLLLTTHSDEYAAGIFASGGRIPGLIFPKGDVSFGSPDDFRNFVNAVRESTDGSRRMSALKNAVEYVRTAEAPNQLELPDLMALGRDDTLALWRVPKSQVGMEAKTGLNGGERNKYDEAALWQNAIEPRLGTFAELLQTRVLDRHGLTLVLETPNFDDDLPLFEIAEKARFAPLTVNQRLAAVGLDPLDDTIYGDLGNHIFMDSRMTQVFPEKAPPPQIPFGGNQQDADTGTAPQEETMPETDVSAKAKLHFEAIRARVEKQYQPRIREAVGKVLAEQKRELASKITDKAQHIAAKPNDTRPWWDERKEYERLRTALEPIVLQAARDVTQQTSATFFRPAGKADSLFDRVLDYVRTKVGQRITGINATTRDKVQKLVASGITEGLSPAQLGDRLEPAFDEYRSELIARTETMLAYNDAAIGTYRDFGVEEVQALDGDDDAACAARNGAIYSISEASGITDHPNGTLDWIPVVKAVDPTADLTDAIRSLAAKETVVNVPAPVVNYTPPAINIPPIVMPEIPAPIVNLPAAKAQLPQEVRVVSSGHQNR